MGNDTECSYCQQGTGRFLPRYDNATVLANAVRKRGGTALSLNMNCSCQTILTVIKVFYLPIDAQENCFKKNIKIYIKRAPTCFVAITIIRERII